MKNKDRAEQYLQEIQNQINQIECQMLEGMDMKRYRSQEGFSQGQLYEYAGSLDNVTTITFRPGSESQDVYGESLTVVFVYTQKERLALEADKSALNDIPKVKAKELLSEISEVLRDQLVKEGLLVKDIVEMIVMPRRDIQNTFASEELRTPNVMNIPFEAVGDGKDIYWMYSSLCRFLEDGIELTPEEHSEYLAYKLVIEPEELTCGERKEIFNEDGAIENREVGYFYLMWKADAHRLKGSDEIMLEQLVENRFINRFQIADKELRSMGLRFDELAKRYPEKARLLLLKILDFHECRYNSVGKYLMYLSYNSFLHIYLRHVSELSVENQFSERSKFQLAEKDLDATMRKVLGSINDEYQAYKEIHPNNRFFRKGSMAYYFNGDYYDIDILPDGQIGTFYKRIERTSQE